jgi:hypothetical protein
MTQAGKSGINSSTFTSRVVPVNTARGDVQALQAKYGTGGCFVATAAYGDYDNPAVVLFRQFRDRVLSQSDTGKRFIAWYYREGPGIASFVRDYPAAGWLTRVFLAPLVGIVFLILYFPLGLFLTPAMTGILLRLGFALLTASAAKGPRGPVHPVQSMRGSVLIGLIVTMVIMSALGGGMVSMFGASTVGNVASMFQPRANYMAESGIAYVVKEYLENDSETNMIANHNRTFTLANGDSFKTFIYPYWFNARAKTNSGTTLVVDPVANINNVDSFPTKFQDTESQSRWLRIGSANFSYTSSTYDPINHTVTFAGVSSGAISAGSKVYPAARAIAQTIYPDGSNSSSRTFKVSTASNSAALADFPKNRGVISFLISGTKYTITYDAVVSDGTGAYFIGLHNIPSASMKPISATGQSIPANTMVVLEKHAEIKSKGIAGTEGGGFTAERMLHYDQSLVKIDVWKKTTIEKKGADLAAGKTDLVGISAHDAAVGALKVTNASDARIYSQVNTSGSIVREYVSGIAVPQLSTAWANSGNTLSYDLQVKMRFSAGDENTTATSAKTSASYMPGLAFRLSGTTSDTLKFYGLSVMRGIQGSSGDQDRDGIPDGLFQAWAANTGATAPGATQLACLRRSNADYEWTNWASTPPRDGRPYIILWQRRITTTGGAWNSDDVTYIDWLSFKEACKEETTTLYRYDGIAPDLLPAGYVAGWYDGQIAGITASNTIAAIRLVDISNILATTLKEGVTILATWKSGADPVYSFITNVTNSGSRVGIVRDPLTGKPVAPRSVATTAGRTYANRPVGYIFPGSIGTDPITYETGAQAPAVLHDFLKNNNYRIYPKEWITVMARMFEIKGDFNCDGIQDDKVNVVQVHYADPDGLPPTTGETYGDAKSIIRRAEPRGTIRWPEDGNYFTTTIWNEKAAAENTVNYSSQVLSVGGWGSGAKKIVERTYDEAVYTDSALLKDWPTVNTDFYISPTGGALGTYEVGLHTLGIDAPNDRAFFDDFGMSIYEKTATGILSGLRSE